MVSHLAQAVLRVDLTFRAPEMTHQDNRCTPIDEVINRGNRRSDSGVVPNGIPVHGNVEIHAYQDPLSLYVGLLQRSEVQIANPYAVPGMPASQTRATKSATRQE